MNNHNRIVEQDAEIARLTDQLHHMKVEYQDEEGITELRAEISRLRGVVRLYLGWCDTCQVYHRCGNCPVTNEPPSKEASEGWSLPLSAPPGADATERAKAIFEALNLVGLTEETELVASALQQYGDERAREAREAAIEIRDSTVRDVNARHRLTRTGH